MPGKTLKGLDLLKSALTQRQAQAQKTISETGQKWVRRGDVEVKRREEYLEEQRLEAEKAKAAEEERLRLFDESVQTRQSKNEVLNKATMDEALLASELLEDDDAEPPLPLSEVVDRLRSMSHPITIFGETDMQRYKRMRLLEKEVDEGKVNPDVLMLEQVNERQRLSLADQEDDQDQEDGAEGGGKEAQDEEEDDKSAASGEEAPAAADDKSDSEAEEPMGGNDDKSDSEDEGAGAAGGTDEKSDSEDEAAGAAPAAPNADDDVAMKDKPKEKLPEVDVNPELMDKCDFIRVWTRKALKAWEKELADLPDSEKQTAKVKTQVAAHRQVRRDVRPLQRRLRMYVMEEWLLGKIHQIVKLADERDYRDASEAYLDLSIGKAAWPVGIGCGGTMLMEDAIGLHDRFNRMANVKDIAFALNDDVTRKFVQALKRLMNVAQRHWPPEDPSKRSG